MTAPTPVDMVVNPNDDRQRWVLWGTGKIDTYGGAPPSAMDTPLWLDRPDQPVGVALHITDVSNGRGYILDFQGGFQPLNGAPALGTGVPLPGGSSPNVDVTSLGVPYAPSMTRRYVDWSWDPAGSGKAVVLDVYGRIYGFNGANPPPRSGARWAWPAAKKLEVRWANGQPTHALTLDWHGGLHGDYGANQAQTAPGYWVGADVARDLKVSTWSATPTAFVLDHWGAVHVSDGSSARGGPYRVGADVARVLHILSASNPRRLVQVWAGGQVFEWEASDPPTVTAGGSPTVSPANPTTSTTRPVLAWAYSDPDGDSQAKYEVYLFTQAYVTANPSVGTNPPAHAAAAIIATVGSGTRIRGVEPDGDLPNGTYRYYVRVTDAAGDVSAWSTRGWTQNVPVPATPTGLSVTSTSDPAKWHVALGVNTATGAQYVRFEYSDDYTSGNPDAATWKPVRGAEQLTRTSTTNAVDYDVPVGRTRYYRAVMFSVTPRTASVPTAPKPGASPNHQEHVLTAVSDPNLGGYVRVVEAPSWSRESKAGVLEGAGAKYPTVISDGVPKARKQTLVVETNSQEEYDRLAALLESNSTLVYREPFGHVVYCRVVGTITYAQQKRLRYEGEPFPLGHRHNVSIPLVEVAQPAPGAL